MIVYASIAQLLLLGSLFSPEDNQAVALLFYNLQHELKKM